MKNTNIYAGYRYPPQIISHVVWLYHRFTLSFRDIEELLAARGIMISHAFLAQDIQVSATYYLRREDLDLQREGVLLPH